MIGPNSPHGQLLQDLDSPRVATRSRAARALGETRDPAVAPALVKALGDRMISVRRQAVIGLALLREPSTLGSLIAMLDDPNDGVRKSAAAAVKKFGKSAYL